MAENTQEQVLEPPVRDFVDDHESVFPIIEKEQKVDFAETLQETIDDYYSMVVDQLPPALNKDGKQIVRTLDLSPEDINEGYVPYDIADLEMAETGFMQWSDNRFKPLSKLCKKPDNLSTLSEDERRLIDLQTDLRHDLASDILGPFIGALTTDPDMHEVFAYYSNPYMVQWPLHIMERIQKQITDKPDIKPIHGQSANQFMYAVFRTLSVMEQDRFKYEIDYQTPFELNGDFDYLLGVLANPLNNIKQIAKEKGLHDVRSMIQVIPDPEKQDHIIIQIRDNIGGMPAELLEESESDPTVQKALERGQSKRTGGTGAGLAIVNEIVRDHFNGSISLKNDIYPETDQTGLVMNISLPGHILSQAA